MKKQKKERQDRLRKRKALADFWIVICNVALGVWISHMEWKEKWYLAVLVLLLMITIAAWIDWCRLDKKDKEEKRAAKQIDFTGIERLILLDEQEKPIKSWDMAGRISLIIGKKAKEQEVEVDVDLEDCEYSSFIDFQHAALNFCLDSWYIEDLESHNGVKVRKIEDGQCYKVMGRPCRVSAGDILYIANTRLLLS